MDETDADVVEFGFCQGPDMKHLSTTCPNTGEISIEEVLTDDERRSSLGLDNGYIWDKVYKTRYLKENKLFFAEGLLHEDTIFVLMLRLTYNKLVRYKKCLYAHRVNETGIMFSVKKNDYGQFDRCKVMVMAVQECLKRGLLEKYYHIIESSFLHVYYGDTMYFVLQRFDHLPDEVKEMQKTVKMLFPNYSNNPYINAPDKQGVKEFLRTVEMDMTEELFQVLKRQINS